VSLNGGGAQGNGTSTSYARSGLGAGDYNLRVQACNKAGCSPWSASSANGHIDNPPPPARVWLCLVQGDPDYFGIKWTGLSGGNHRMKVDGSQFQALHTGSGPSGTLVTQSFVWWDGPGTPDPDGNNVYRPVWTDGSGTPDIPGDSTAVRDMPAC